MTRKPLKLKNSVGAFLSIDPQTGWIESILIHAGDDQEQNAVENALSRITKSNHWGWVKRLIGLPKKLLN